MAPGGKQRLLNKKLIALEKVAPKDLRYFEYRGLVVGLCNITNIGPLRGLALFLAAFLPMLALSEGVDALGY